MIEYARIITKSSDGPPTIPPSASHDNGDWSSTDIYEHEIYMDNLTGLTYTRHGDEIILLGSGESSTVNHDTSLTGDGSTSKPLGVALDPSADNQAEITADGLLVHPVDVNWGAIGGDITSQNDLQLALDAKFDVPTGDTTQYLDGAGTPTTFPTLASADKMVTVGRNSTGATLYKGTIVYISGSTGNRPNFVKAQANAESTSAGTFGVIEADIANNADGNCVTIGTINDLDTRSSAPHPFTSDTLADGDTIYLSRSTPGFITNVKPSAPNHLVYLGKVVRTSPTNGTIVYRVQNGYELDEIHDVTTTDYTTPQDEDSVLTLDSTQELWKRLTLFNLRVFLKTYFDTIYQSVITPGTTSQYYRGDKTFQTLDKTAVGLSNVDNTSDASKPVSTAQATAIALKENSANKATTMTGNTTSNTLFLTAKAIYDWATGLFQTILVSGTNIKTINGSSILGSGNLVVGGASNPSVVGIQSGNATTSNTAGVTISKTITINANTLASSCVLDFIARMRRLSGTSSMGFIQVYINTSNSLTGATLIAKSNLFASTDAVGTMIRTFIISGGDFISHNASDPQNTDVINSMSVMSGVPFSVTTTNYILIAINNSSTDSLVINTAKLVQNA